MNASFKQLTFAREYRGLTQSELASKIKGLSQPNLSKFEKGLQTLSDDLVERIMEYLEFPMSFLTASISTEITNAHYRKKASLTKGKKDRIERQSKLIGYVIDCMSAHLEFPDTHIRSIDLDDGYTPEDVAKYARNYFRLGDRPVENIVSLLENHGIIVIERNFGTDDFDGVSFITDKGFYVTVINKAYSNDRKRLTLAHELGHIIMHLDPSFIISSHRDKEVEAYRFASEFLMPTAYIKPSLNNLKISYLGTLKSYWLTSMASIIHRAYDLGTIDKNRYTYLNIELSRNGFKKREPINVMIDEPVILRDGYEILSKEFQFNIEYLSHEFCLPQDVLNDIYYETPFSSIKFELKHAIQ